jgi:hypothetical protein
MISKDAEQFAHEIFIRTTVGKISMFAFRGLGQLGLPHAKDEKARSWERIYSRVFASERNN